MTLTELRDDGLWVFVDGKHVATIPRDNFPDVVLKMVGALKERSRPPHLRPVPTPDRQ